MGIGLLLGVITTGLMIWGLGFWTTVAISLSSALVVCLMVRDASTAPVRAARREQRARAWAHALAKESAGRTE